MAVKSILCRRRSARLAPMVSTLVDAGCTVATAQNGKQAIEATAQKPNLIIQPTSRVQAQPLTAEEQATVDGHAAVTIVSSLAPAFAPTVPAGITEIKTANN